MLTFFDVLVLFLLVFAASRMPDLDMMMDQVWLAILTIAVFMCIFNNTIHLWFITAERFLLK